MPRHLNTLPTRKSSWLSRSRYTVSGLMICSVVFCVAAVVPVSSRPRFEFAARYALVATKFAARPDGCAPPAPLPLVFVRPGMLRNVDRQLHIHLGNRVDDEALEAGQPRLHQVAELLRQLRAGSPRCPPALVGPIGQHFRHLRDDGAVVGDRMPGAGPGLEPQAVLEPSADADVHAVPVLVLVAVLVRQRVVVLGLSELVRVDVVVGQLVAAAVRAAAASVGTVMLNC